MSGVNLQSNIATSGATSTAAAGHSYTVQPGDTLSKIAARNGLSVEQLLAKNPQIKNADLIYPGDQINLGSARKYTVQAGDTITEIASRFGVSTNQLISANPQVSNPDRIYVGDQLNVPAGASSNGSGSGSVNNNPGSATEPGRTNPTQPPVSTNPGTGSTGSYGSSSPLSAIVARGESNGAGGYNAYNRGVAGDSSRPMDLTNMTVREIMASQSQRGGLFAVGKYQIIPDTMREVVRNLGINPDQKFTPELQERMFHDYLIDEKRPQIRDYITGETNGASGLQRAQVALAQEFASIADPRTNKSYYDGDSAGNHSSVTARESADALNAMRAQYQTNIRNGMSAEQAWQALSGGTTASTSAATGSTPTGTSNVAVPKAIENGGYLNKGDTGPDVANLQRLLIANGANIKVTGNFDNATARAVEAFKADPQHPLGTAQGQPQSAVGRTTWEKLNQYAESAPSSGTPGTGGATATTGAGKIPSTAGMSESQKYDLYAGYLNQFGSSAAKQDLANGQRVILGLRHDTNTSANNGLGAYDDRVVVIWQDSSGKHVREFRAATEGSAQYDPQSPYFRRAGGSSDANGDGVYDVPRLADGTYGFRRDYWSNGGQVQTNGQNILSGTTNQTVQRDSNHDGKWDANDPGRRDLSGQDFGIYFHRGSDSGNTYSSGCQTLPQSEFNQFWRALGTQNNFNYTLVNESRL